MLNQRIITLKKRKDFVAANQHGKKWVASTVIVQVLPLPDTDTHIEVGYTVTKKNGNAVTRNRIKRRLRAAVAKIFPTQATEGFAYVLIGRVETSTADFDKICHDLKWCLKRLEVLKPCSEQ